MPMTCDGENPASMHFVIAPGSGAHARRSAPRNRRRACREQAPCSPVVRSARPGFSERKRAAQAIDATDTTPLGSASAGRARRRHRAPAASEAARMLPLASVAKGVRGVDDDARAGKPRAPCRPRRACPHAPRCPEARPKARLRTRLPRRHGRGCPPRSPIRTEGGPRWCRRRCAAPARMRAPSLRAAWARDR